MDNDPPNPALESEVKENAAIDPVVEDATRKSDLDVAVENEVTQMHREGMEQHRERMIQELNEINQRFKHHTPDENQVETMKELEKIYSYLAKMILAVCPRSADRTHALRQLQDSKMWANTSIMLEGKI